MRMNDHLAGVWAFVLLLFLGAAPIAQTGGIHPLTEETLAEALAIEQTSQVPSSVFTGSLPWNLYLRTPYVTAALQAADAKRRYLPTPKLTLKDIDNTHVTIQVDTSDSFINAESVARIVLKRNGEIVQPTSQSLAPRTIQNGMGATRIINQGRFSFAIECFDASQPLTIVIVGEQHTLEIPMSTSMLRQYR